MAAALSLLLRLLLAVLLSAGAQAAEPLVWWVDSPEEAVLVEAALQEVWPHAPLQIQLGAPPPGAPGVTLQAAGGLRFFDGEIERVRDSVVDTRTAAALVRSWYTPPLEVVSLAPPPTPPLPPPPERSRPHGNSGAMAGPASRSPGRGPAFHFAVQAASPHLIALVELDPAERVRQVSETGGGSGGGLVVRRLGATGGVRLTQTLPQGWTLEAVGTLGLRLHTTATLERPDVLALTPLPTAALRARMWNPAAEDGPRLGGGVMVSFDGLSSQQWYDEAHTAQLRPLTVALEFGILLERPPRDG